MRNIIINELKKTKLLAIIRSVETEKILSIAKALFEGGIRLLEITFPQSHPEQFNKTLDAIESVHKQYGNDLPVGAGTIITVEQVDMANSAGAQFIVSPNIDAEVIARTKELGMISIPGAMTPTEILKAYDRGADFVKVFPASDLGADYIKAIRAPISHVPLLAVGGINCKNINDFLKVGVVGAGVGGSLVREEFIQKGDFERITSTAFELIKAVNN